MVTLRRHVKVAYPLTILSLSSPCTAIYFILCPLDLNLRCHVPKHLQLFRKRVGQKRKPHVYQVSRLWWMRKSARCAPLLDSHDHQVIMVNNNHFNNPLEWVSGQLQPQPIMSKPNISRCNTLVLIQFVPATNCASPGQIVLLPLNNAYKQYMERSFMGNVPLWE